MKIQSPADSRGFPTTNDIVKIAAFPAGTPKEHEVWWITVKIYACFLAGYRVKEGLPGKIPHSAFIEKGAV